MTAPRAALGERFWAAKRRLASAMLWAGATLGTLLALTPLALVLYYVAIQGIPALSLAFFTRLPAPVGEPGGGMGNAILGTAILVGLASLVGLPVGILGGIYLAEFGRRRFGAVVRFAADVISGVPSIVVGIFIYALVVVRMGHFSALAGGAALGVMMIPAVMRTTEEVLRLVPMSLREASFALGATNCRTVFRVVLVAARSGVITGVLLAMARVAGETAPLLFTAGNSRYWPGSLNDWIASLPVQIYTYAIAPYDDWHAQAWAGALVLVTMVLVLSAAARYATRGRLRVVR